MRLEFKDGVVVQFNETYEKYSVFEGTFVEDSNVEHVGITLTLENGTTIEITSYQENNYSKPVGMGKLVEFVPKCINYIVEGTADKTIAQFIHFILTCSERREAHLCITDSIGNQTTVYYGDYYKEYYTIDGELDKFLSQILDVDRITTSERFSFSEPYQAEQLMTAELQQIIKPFL